MTFKPTLFKTIMSIIIGVIIGAIVSVLISISSYGGISLDNFINLNLVIYSVIGILLIYIIWSLFQNIIKILLILIIVVVIIIAGIFGYYYFLGDKGKTTVCTLEAKICPDGTSVSRTGADCEFEKCPEVSEEITTCTELGCSESDVYAGSINSDKYYLCSCYYAKQILPKNVVCFMTDEQALDDGRTKSEC